MLLDRIGTAEERQGRGDRERGHRLAGEYAIAYFKHTVTDFIGGNKL